MSFIALMHAFSPRLNIIVIVMVGFGEEICILCCLEGLYLFSQIMPEIFVFSYIIVTNHVQCFI